MEESNPNIPQISPEEEAKLERMASRRTGFKKHFAIFFLVNAFLWVVWYFLFRDSAESTFLMAILFVFLVWFLGIALHYMIVYKWTKSYKEKELTSLKKMRLRQLQEIESLKAEMAPKADAVQEDLPEEETVEEEEPEHRSPNYID
ncbi:MAG: 2TM domain-containing protein [Bacteroidales bacterium]|nr:2TM domain-containing protein [Bacteroidales bacterium]MBR4637588.1 2TM domain-containing protein [Bacteroidales bacterium]MBR6173977.1 2TM domain-containing protein [Bacteroidales bacterium]MBR6903627.1 2TM domain-containing protein [Bacteroidales bacterium]